MATNTIPIAVEIIAPADFSKSGEALVRVIVEDVSELDAPAKTIAQTRIETTVEPGKHINTTVEVPLDAVYSRGSYNVRAHVSLSHTEAIKPGDLITTQSFPLRIEERTPRLSLLLREVH